MHRVTVPMWGTLLPAPPHNAGSARRYPAPYVVGGSSYSAVLGLLAVGLGGSGVAVAVMTRTTDGLVLRGAPTGAVTLRCTAAQNEDAPFGAPGTPLRSMTKW